MTRKLDRIDGRISSFLQNSIWWRVRAIVNVIVKETEVGCGEVVPSQSGAQGGAMIMLNQWEPSTYSVYTNHDSAVQ